MTDTTPSSSEAAVHVYLFFGGRCEEAIAFYSKAIGARLDMLMRFDESPDPVPPEMVPPGFDKKIMHASLYIGDTLVMASDGCETTTRPSGFSLSLSMPNEREVDRAFAALSEGGSITMPLGRTFWSSRFGMLTDKFGVGWMVSLAHD